MILRPTNVHLEGVVNAEEEGNRQGRSRREGGIGGMREEGGRRKEEGSGREGREGS